MGQFINDYEKSFPKEEEKKMVNLDEQDIPTMTFQDMKDYFNGLKESITAEMRKEILEYMRKENGVDDTDTQNNNNNNGVDDNNKEE